MDDLLKAIDKRAQGSVLGYDGSRWAQMGIVAGIEIATASVRVSGSGRYLRSLQSLCDIDTLEVGSKVYLGRPGRSRRWIIVGLVSN